MAIRENSLLQKPSSDTVPKKKEVKSTLGSKLVLYLGPKKKQMIFKIHRLCVIYCSLLD